MQPTQAFFILGQSGAAPVPTISSINFSQGNPGGGGANIILTGTNMSGVTTINGAWASGAATSSTSPSATSATTVTFTLPAHAASTGTFSVTSPGGTSNTIAFEYWSLASLALTHYERASYTGAPWSGTASAGSSGTRSFAAGTTSPTVGTAVAGLTPASCTASRSLVSATPMASCITASAYTMIVLIKVGSANAAGAQPFNSDAILADSGGGAYCGMAVSTSGIQPYHYNSTDYNGPTAGAGAGYATGSWMLVFGFYDGTNLKVQINGNTPVSLARTNIGAGYSGSSGALKLNENFNTAGSGGATADYLEVGMMASAISAGNITKARLYVQQLYGLSV